MNNNDLLFSSQGSQQVLNPGFRGMKSQHSGGAHGQGGSNHGGQFMHRGMGMGMGIGGIGSMATTHADEQYNYSIPSEQIYSAQNLS